MTEKGSPTPPDKPKPGSRPRGTSTGRTTSSSGRNSPPVVRIARRHLWIAGAAGLGVLLLGVWLVVTTLPRLLSTPPDTDVAAPDPAPAVAEDPRRIQVTLYYVSANGSALTPVNREVLYGATPSEQARRLVEAAVEAPEDRRSAIPAGTTVRSVFLASGLAYVDLGGAIVSGHSGGSLNEALAVYAIVNAITVNLPDITAVQILVEGRQVDTLAGHLDLRYPLGRALDWVQKGP